jgi:hypothetical protein
MERDFQRTLQRIVLGRERRASCGLGRRFSWSSFSRKLWRENNIWGKGKIRRAKEKGIKESE